MHSGLIEHGAISRERAETDLSWLPSLALCLVSFAFAATVAWGVFEAIPHLEDEQANLFQAKVFARGRITNPAPAVPEAFFVPYVITRNGQQFSKYPPGFPLLLAAGVLVGQPWAVNALAAALGILATYLLGRDLFNRKTGLLAAALGITSPMYLLLSGTLLSHTTNLAALTFFAWTFIRARQSTELRRNAFAWLAGLAGGLALAIRPWTAFGVGLPFALLGAIDLLRRRERLPGIYGRMIAAFVLVGSLWPLYNAVTTGSPLTNTYTLFWDYDRVGFGAGIGSSSEGYDGADAWLNLRLGLASLNDFLLGWPNWPLKGVSLIWPVAALSLMLRPRGRPELLLLVPACTLVVVHMAYWASSAGLYGPRYYAEAMPFLWLLVARGLLKASQWRPARIVVAAGFAVCLTWNVCCFSASRFAQARGLYGISRADTGRIAAAGIHNALVFVHSDYWTEYANLSWLNRADLRTSDVVFAKDSGTKMNGVVAKSFPTRGVFCYDRDQPTPLTTCDPSLQNEPGDKR